MPGVYDSVLKEVFLREPNDLVRLLGIEGEAVVERNTDVSASGRSCDMLFQVSNPNQLVQVEIQTYYDPKIPKRQLEYRVLSGLKLETLPKMRSILILMCPQADGEALTGVLEEDDIRFRYEVIRLWEIDVSHLLNLSVHLLPLAPLCTKNPNELAGVLRLMQDRLLKENVPEAQQRDIWGQTEVLIGLLTNKTHAESLIRTINMLDLRASSTFRSIYEEGEAIGEARGKLEGSIEEVRRLLISFGTNRLGAMDASTSDHVNSITDLKVLEGYLEKLFNGVESWSTLVG